MSIETLNRESAVFSAPSQTASFIYCIIEKNEGSPELNLNSDMKEISCNDIAAISRRIGRKEVNEIENGRPQEWIMNYQQVNGEMFRRRNMIPVRFGNIAGRNEEVEQFLASAYMHIKSSMAKVRGRAEFTVQVYWNLDEALREILRDDGLRTEGDRIEIGRMLYEAAECKKKEITDAAHIKLSAVAVDSSEGRLTDKSMIMNRSYLIEKSAEQVFDNAVSELGRENKSYISFKYSGPLPPYSFAPLEFEEGNFEVIDRARKELELPERARSAQIKAAYRNMSLKYHPDMNPNGSRSAERFRRIANAFQTLEAYCRSYWMSCTSDGDIEYSFSKDIVEKIFIVNRKI